MSKLIIIIMRINLRIIYVQLLMKKRIATDENI